MAGSNVISFPGRNYLGKNGYPLNELTTDRYSDGAVGTPNPPKKASGNPYIDPETGERYPGAPGS
jgi:hypothetical protein